MKTNAIIRIIIWSIVIVLLCGILFVGLNFRTFSTVRSSLRRNGDSSVATHIPEPVTSTDPTSNVLDTDTAIRIPSSGVREIEIEWVSGMISLGAADVEEIQFSESEVSNSKYAAQWKQKDGKLTIQFCEETTFHGFSSWKNLSKDLTVFVPRDWVCNSLEIDAASASLRVYDMTIREVEVDTASGDFLFENCIVDELDLDSASGDVRFNGTLNSLDCDVASASVYAVLENVPSRINMDSMSGDLDITLPPEAGFTLTMDTMCSDFTSDFATTSRNGSHVCGDGKCRITVDGMSGDVVIRMGGDAAPTGATSTIPTPPPLETRVTATKHTHSDACQTELHSCPDVSACYDAVAKMQQVSITCAKTSDCITTLISQEEIEAFVKALDLDA